MQVNKAALFASSVEVTDAEEETATLWSGDLWGVKYQRHTEQSKQAFELEVAGKRLTLKQAPAALLQPGITGTVVWDGAVDAALCLEHWADGGVMRLRGARAVELGAGTGLLGLAAAALGADTVLTDQECQVKLIAANASANSPLQGKVEVLELDWEDRDDGVRACGSPVHLVLMADCVYNEEIVSALLATAAALCGTWGETLCIVSLELRCDATHEAFLVEALKLFRVTRLGDAVLHPDAVTPRSKIYVLEKKQGAVTEPA